ncbi:MAG TPA: DMT family transporter [Microterricola sp.]|uniref:Inner membrane transporter YedA n=1 Tax=Microbacterium terrae TaxID=69369 RepID=A0A0M2GW98_9MICO|nr:DMT family transporter [Microbacterium terrae]KJL37767.1 putative inner membrane transporter YedA [Microbacterium terrae]MBP1076599.1 drug/metabolite transporter (DMT)-like permease [Microbacterium terrae]GLJ97427.1 membrane protein [Microbacterium terrae]
MNDAQRFDARAWVLFAIMAVLWGVPYLFISIAVESYSPAAVVAGRTLLGALLLLPFALRQRALRPAFAKIGWVLLFGAIEMAGPFLLLGHAEQTLPSGLTGLLVATVPLFAAIIAFGGGDRSVLSPARIIGLCVGFAGVFVIVAGPGLAVPGGGGLLAVGEVLLVAVLYSIAPFVIATKLRDVPSLGTITLALFAVGLFYTPIAFLTQHEVPTVPSTVALVALAVLCTALAFIVFFALIARVGPVRAPLFTYVNPVVAIALGAIVLGEALTTGLLIGFPLVILGCWLAATGGRFRVPRGDLVAELPADTQR